MKVFIEIIIPLIFIVILLGVMPLLCMRVVHVGNKKKGE